MSTRRSKAQGRQTRATGPRRWVDAAGWNIWYTANTLNAGPWIQGAATCVWRKRKYWRKTRRTVRHASNDLANATPF